MGFVSSIPWKDRFEKHRALWAQKVGGLTHDEGRFDARFLGRLLPADEPGSLDVGCIRSECGSHEEGIRAYFGWDRVVGDELFWFRSLNVTDTPDWATEMWRAHQPPADTERQMYQTALTEKKLQQRAQGVLQWLR